MMKLYYFNWNALRTVRAQVADRPPYYSTDSPETATSLEQLLILPADCPAPLGGPSAVHVSNLPETTTSLEKSQTLLRIVRAQAADRPQLNPTNPTRDTVSG